MPQPEPVMSALSQAGRRQRKKRDTRDALAREALRLFILQGYDNTTVDQITDEVDVSQRTFFRYFASKEDVVLSPITAIDEAFLATLEARPASENPLEAMCGSFRAVLEQVHRNELEGVDPILHMSVMQLIERTPGLLAQHLRRSERMEDQLVAVISRREGLDPKSDRRPRVIVATFGAIGRVTTRIWFLRAEGDQQSITAELKSSLDLLGPALFGNWRRDSDPLPEHP
ncbi:TetR family transcriptional regulator [Kitasatospora sp. NPDC059327]|uniref:TetR family transcriptional regulator n=1 Tax=Kitasatospora sp. NPDC059327 TaxID=3346803 RepID=UPI0036786E06